MIWLHEASVGEWGDGLYLSLLQMVSGQIFSGRVQTPKVRAKAQAANESLFALTDSWRWSLLTGRQQGEDVSPAG